VKKKAKRLDSVFAPGTLTALLWIALMASTSALLAWHLYSSGPQRAREALTDGRGEILVLTQPKAATPSKADGTLADSSDASMFPKQTPDSAAPTPLAPGKNQSLTVFKPDLAEQSDFGPVPKISTDGAKPWLVYSHPFTRHGSAPVIAILVTGVGMNKQASDLALQLPPEMSLGIAAYAPQAKSWNDAARALGHETLMDAPVEPMDIAQIDLGPHALLAMNSAEDNLRHMRWILSRAPGSLGVDFSATERLSATQLSALPLYRFLVDHGLLLALAPGGPSADQDTLLSQSVLPFVRADFRLDDSLSQDDIAHQLAALENLAVRRGYAFGVGRAYPITLKALSQWSQQLDKKGIILAPVSALARMKFS